MADKNLYKTIFCGKLINDMYVLVTNGLRILLVHYVLLEISINLGETINIRLLQTVYVEIKWQ